jgi:preprotein translocase subunit YajC
MSGFFILIILFAAVWVIFLLPARRRRAQHEAMQETVVAGDDVITAGGIHGRVVAAEDDVVDLEIAPSVVVKLDRRAVAAVAREVADEEEPEPGDEHEESAGTSAEPR